MKLLDFLTERALTQKTGAAIEDISTALASMGFKDIKRKGSVIQVMVQIPEKTNKNQYRKDIGQNIAKSLAKSLKAKYNPMKFGPAGSSTGHVEFANSVFKVEVKDIGKQGDQSAGMVNEVGFYSMLASVIEKYESVDITFVDKNNNKLTVNGVVGIGRTGKDVKGGKKADAVLHTADNRVPISLKQLNAESWESADNLFGAKAKEVLQMLIKEKAVKLIKTGVSLGKLTKGRPEYKLSKEVVVQPTTDEALRAIFGTDLRPEGGVIIQDFQPHHFLQKDNKVAVECYAIIKDIDDIPDSHMMFWQIRNLSGRFSRALGIQGLKVSAVTASRAFGRKGDKDVVYVSNDGRILKS